MKLLVTSLSVLPQAWFSHPHTDPVIDFIREENRVHQETCKCAAALPTEEADPAKKVVKLSFAEELIRCQQVVTPSGKLVF